MTITTASQTAIALELPGEVSGAYALMDALHRHGVEHIFGYPGGAILPIYDELLLAEQRGWLKHVLVRHEQGGTLLMPMPGPQARWEFVLAPRARGPRIW